jgi:hypothetical protein
MKPEIEFDATEVFSHIFVSTTWSTSLGHGKATVNFTNSGTVTISGEEFTYDFVHQPTPAILIHKGETLMFKFEWFDDVKYFKSKSPYNAGFELLKPMSNMLEWNKLCDSRTLKRKERLARATAAKKGIVKRQTTDTRGYFIPDYMILKEFPDHKTKHKLAIGLIAADRPHYFKRVFPAIVQSVALAEIEVDWYLFVDRVKPDARDELAQIELFNNMVKGGTVIRRDVNFGCGGNIINARAILLDQLDYEAAYIFEDDMVPHPSYVSVCESLAKYAERVSTPEINYGIVQGWNWFTLSSGAAQRYASYVTPTCSNLWGYRITRKCWSDISEFMYFYLNTFLKNCRYADRDHRSIATWLRNQTRNYVVPDLPVFGNKCPAFSEKIVRYLAGPPTGQDAATVVACLLANQYRLAPVVARGDYIGKMGIHMNPRQWAADGYDALKSVDIGYDHDQWDELVGHVTDDFKQVNSVEGLVSA